MTNLALLCSLLFNFFGIFLDGDRRVIDAADLALHGFDIFVQELEHVLLLVFANAETFDAVLNKKLEFFFGLCVR